MCAPLVPGRLSDARALAALAAEVSWVYPRKVGKPARKPCPVPATSGVEPEEGATPGEEQADDDDAEEAEADTEQEEEQEETERDGEEDEGVEVE